MKRIFSSNSFYFTVYRYGSSHYTDSRGGCHMHYIGMLNRGRCRIVTEDAVLEAGPGEPFYIPKGLRYQSYWSGDEAIELLSFGFGYFPEAMGAGFALQRLPDALADRVRALPAMGRPDSGALGDLYGLLGELALHMMPEGQEPWMRTLERAQSYMRRYPDHRMSQVAKHCCVSESALYSAFQRSGRTPNDTRQAILAEEAVRLLTTTDRSVQEISDELGFSSTSYFRKVLKKHTGSSPRDIRKNTRAL